MTTEPPTARTAVLRDYPLRLWARQQEYTQELLREFALLVEGDRSGETRHPAPFQLLRLAEHFSSTYGPQLDAITHERQSALNQGLDRIDSRVPLLDGLPDLLDRVATVLASVDEFCRRGTLLSLPRDEILVRLFDWTSDQLKAQYADGESAPWPGPFELPARTA